MHGSTSSRRENPLHLRVDNLDDLTGHNPGAPSLETETGALRRSGHEVSNPLSAALGEQEQSGAAVVNVLDNVAGGEKGSSRARERW